LKDEPRSAESATGNSQGCEAPGTLEKLMRALKRAKEVSPALSGLGSNPIPPQGFHPWLLPVALSALWKQHPQNPMRSENLK
jgi:hypothetical protein